MIKPADAGSQFGNQWYGSRFMFERNKIILTIGLLAIAIGAIILFVTTRPKPQEGEIRFLEQLELLVYEGKFNEALEGCRNLDMSTLERRVKSGTGADDATHATNCYHVAKLTFGYYCRYMHGPKSIKTKPFNEVCGNVSEFADRVRDMPGLEKDEREYLEWMKICLGIWPDVVNAVDSQDIESLRSIVKQWYSLETQVFKYGRRKFTTSMQLLGDHIVSSPRFHDFSDTFLWDAQNLMAEYVGEFGTTFFQ